jgi:SPP1 gp7 family putative phage head morphogenesis protein
LRAIGPLPRRRRIPRQQQPDLIRKAYFDAIVPFLGPSRRAVDSVKGQIFRLLSDERRAQEKMDDEHGRLDQARKLIDDAARKAADAFNPKALKEVALKFGQRTADFQRDQLDRQVQAAMSVPLSAIEKPITDKLYGFAQTNVDLITTVPERYIDRIRSDVEDAFEQGIEPGDLADQFEERYGMAEDDAQRIARDQIGKLAAQLNQERQQAMGVTSYVWRTMNDERVCEDCAPMDGQTFEWSDPPGDGHPGEHHPMDRCYAEPDFSAILEGADDES